MRDLMIHVERIVRPVRAFASTKLRMRFELLNHLESALEEELERGATESQAIGYAIQRLGDAAEMTVALQRSVPMHQRLLLAKLPAPAILERWEKSCDKRFRFMRHLTLVHEMFLISSVIVLSIMALELSAKDLIVDRSALAGDAPFRLRVYIFIAWTLANGLAVAGCGFVAVVSAQPRQFCRRVVGFALAIICMQLLWSLLISEAFGGGGSLTIQQWNTSLTLGFGMVLAMTLVARLLASLRRPYDQWLTLDIAQ